MSDGDGVVEKKNDEVRLVKDYVKTAGQELKP
jgi:hypothetical protein